MKKVFISYRRSDSYVTNKLAEYLRNEFGHDNIFFDTESMTPGAHWPDTIKNSLMHADLMLLIIGPNWLHIQDEQSGRRRIDMEQDWVRREIITFLERKEKNSELLLVPVLVNEAKLPDKQHLDDVLSPICDLQVLKLYNTESPLDYFPVRIFLLKVILNPVW